MSPISEYPQVAYAGKGQWVLTDDLHYQSRLGKITVPKGFRTDLDSVPRLPLAYWLCKGAAVVAPIVHDWLYREGSIGDYVITRKQADDIFLEIMEEEGVSRWRRRLVWLGVRAGGWRPWGDYREDEEDPEFI